MQVAFDRVVITWRADFAGSHDITLELSTDEQADERIALIRGLVEWWEEKERARIAAAPVTWEGFFF